MEKGRSAHVGLCRFAHMLPRLDFEMSHCSKLVTVWTVSWEQGIVAVLIGSPSHREFAIVAVTFSGPGNNSSRACGHPKGQSNKYRFLLPCSGGFNVAVMARAHGEVDRL